MDTDERGESVAEVELRAFDGDVEQARRDTVAVEEPLEIRLSYRAELGQRTMRAVSVTMRTPGRDFELAVGFLFTEGIVRSAADIAGVDFCGPPPPGRPHSNIVRVELADGVRVDTTRLQRNFFSSSSCGICGKASLDALDLEAGQVLEGAEPTIAPSVVHGLPKTLRTAQAVFDETGGLHAAGLFDAHGALLLCREDVGRHNAVDKLVGARVLGGQVPLSGLLLQVSGRVSFEILQKALAARLPVVVAVGAPSSLAIDLAERFGMTLIGFARDGRFNVYAGRQRIAG